MSSPSPINPATIVPLVDLTLLDAAATEAQIKALCEKAVAAGTAAVCVLPQHVAMARAFIPVSSPVLVATTPGGFPIPSDDLAFRVKDVKDTIAAGAAEVDVVLEPGQDWEVAREHIAALRAAAGTTTMKVILETPLRGEDDLRRACALCLELGVDILKTCTGKRGSADATAVRILAEEITKYEAATGRRAGLKISGGVRNTVEAQTLLGVAQAANAALTLTPERLRIGASALLDALLEAIRGTNSTPAAASDSTY